tara:strand:+ start:104 stop:265 length:162 start_codon:yes stop_codon:yes gene_type:complete
MDLDGILKGCIKIYLIKRAAINAKSKDLKVVNILDLIELSLDIVVLNYIEPNN